MKFAILKFKITLFFAVLVLFISVFANRVVLAKSQTIVTYDLSTNNLPAEFVYTTNLSGLTKKVFQKINFERKRRRLKPMLWHKDLANLAYEYSKKMAEENFFDHYDKNGNSIVERVEDYEINDWLKVGENLFQGDGYRKMADVAVQGWLKSPTHRRNIFDKEWTHTGIGVYKSKRNGTYITQVFMKK